MNRYDVVRLHGGGLAGSSVVRAPILYIGNLPRVRSPPGLRLAGVTASIADFYSAGSGFESLAGHLASLAQRKRRRHLSARFWVRVPGDAFKIMLR